MRITYSCPICSLTFANVRASQNHLISAHTSARPFVCPTCSKRYGDQRKLANHRRNFHSGINKNKRKRCEHCQYVGGENNMGVHLMAMHPDKVNVLRCRSCKYRTMQKHFLQKHYLTKHQLTLEQAEQRAAQIPLEEPSALSVQSAQDQHSEEAAQAVATLEGQIFY